MRLDRALTANERRAELCQKARTVRHVANLLDQRTQALHCAGGARHVKSEGRGGRRPTLAWGEPFLGRAQLTPQRKKHVHFAGASTFKTSRKSREKKLCAKGEASGCSYVICGRIRRGRGAVITEIPEEQGGALGMATATSHGCFRYQANAPPFIATMLIIGVCMHLRGVTSPACMQCGEAQHAASLAQKPQRALPLAGPGSAWHPTAPAGAFADRGQGCAACYGGSHSPSS